jgi:hypothetical protein
LYMNGSSVGSGTSTINSFRDEFRIWVNDGDSWTTPKYMTWYMSDLIVENKARTAEETANYYNSTKSNYWL